MTEQGGPTKPSGAMGPSEPNEPIRRIEAALSRLGAEHEPPPGWEARVLAAVATKQRRPWWMYAGGGVALAAAAAVVIVVLLPPRVQAPELAIAVTARRHEAVRTVQDQELVIGDVAQIAVSIGRRHRIVQVYRDESHLVLSCPQDPTCRVSQNAIAVDVTITDVGNYVVVAASSDDPLPPLTGKLDADAAALTRAGVAQKQDKWIVR